MNSIKKHAVVAGALLAIGFVFGLANPAKAVDISSNNVAGLTVRITPNADRGVEVTSGNVNLDLGTVDMNTSTVTVKPATVTILGNMSNTELTLAAAITPDWTFDDDPITADQDKLATWALFSTVNITSAPSVNDFTVGNSTINVAAQSFGAVRVGASGSNGTRFEGLWSGSDMDAMAAGSAHHLWVRMRTPSITSTSNQQVITFTLTAVQGD